MNETVNTQTAEEISKTPDIPENTLLNEPEYILKKKFNFAAIPSVFVVFSYFLLLISQAYVLIINYVRYKYEAWDWITKEDLIRDLVGVLFVAFTAVVCLVLCVFLFARLKNFVLGIPLIACTFYPIWQLVPRAVKVIKPVIEFKKFNVEIDGYLAMQLAPNTLYSLCMACFALAFIFASVCVFVAASKKSESKAKKLCFIPAAVFSFGIILYVLYSAIGFYFDYFKYTYTSVIDVVFAFILNYALDLMIIYIPECITILLLCLWISNPYKKVLKKVPEAKKAKEKAETEKKIAETEIKEEKVSKPVPTPMKPVAPPSPKPVAPPPMRPVPKQAPVMNTSRAPVVSTASAQKENIELIKQYKELLDMGAITQEEYDKKKNKLLDN